MGRPIGRRSADDGLPRAFDGSESDAHLRVAARRRELLDGLALPVAAEKIHAAVRAGRIALKHLFDEAHRLEVLAPVERRAETETADRVCDGYLVGRLPLMLAANGRFHRRPLRHEVVLDRRANRRQLNAVLADTMQELHDCGDAEARRQWPLRVGAFTFRLVDVRIGRPARSTRLHRVGREAPQVLDQREFQHAGPRPQLADRQRRDALIAVDEERQLLAIETAVAVPHQLHRHRVDSRVAGMLARGERGELPVVARGQVLANVADLVRHAGESCPAAIRRRR